jgi:hypothetical protein
MQREEIEARSSYLRASRENANLDPGAVVEAPDVSPAGVPPAATSVSWSITVTVDSRSRTVAFAGEVGSPVGFDVPAGLNVEATPTIAGQNLVATLDVYEGRHLIATLYASADLQKPLDLQRAANVDISNVVAGRVGYLVSASITGSPL